MLTAIGAYDIAHHASFHLCKLDAQKCVKQSLGQYFPRYSPSAPFEPFSTGPFARLTRMALVPGGHRACSTGPCIGAAW